jgi:hypothetical protein
MEGYYMTDDDFNNLMGLLSEDCDAYITSAFDKLSNYNFDLLVGHIAKRLLIDGCCMANPDELEELCGEVTVFLEEEAYGRYGLEGLYTMYKNKGTLTPKPDIPTIDTSAQLSPEAKAEQEFINAHIVHFHGSDANYEALGHTLLEVWYRGKDSFFKQAFEKFKQFDNVSILNVATQEVVKTIDCRISRQTFSDLQEDLYGILEKLYPETTLRGLYASCNPFYGDIPSVFNEVISQHELNYTKLAEILNSNKAHIRAVAKSVVSAKPHDIIMFCGVFDISLSEWRKLCPAVEAVISHYNRRDPNKFNNLVKDLSAQNNFTIK